MEPTQLSPIYVDQDPDLDTKPVSLNTIPPEPTVSIDTGQTGPDTALSQPLARQRAFKTYIGLGNVLGKNQDELEQHFVNGDEWAIRQQAAAALDIKNKQDSVNLVQDLAAKAANTGTALDKDTVSILLNPETPANQPTDPALVIEKGWGYGYMNSLDNADINMQHTLLTEAKQEIPRQEQDMKALGGTFIAKRDFFLNYAQNIQQTLDKQSYVGYSADFAKQLVPFYNEVLLRGWMKNTSSLQGVFLGNNLEAQAHEYYGMTMPEMKEKAMQVLENLRARNPQVAMQYAQAMAGMSTNDKILNNIYTPLDILGVYDAGKIGLAAFRKASIYNRTQNAMRTAVKGSNIPTPTPGTIAEAAGDLSESAVQNSTKTTLNALQGTLSPSAIATNPIPEAFNVIKSNISANPGALSREATTRLEDQVASAAANAQDLIERTVRVERIPVAAATEKVNRAIRDSMLDQFRGQENTILRFEDAVRDPYTNTRSVNVWLGDYDATAFRSEEQAVTAARWRGYGNAKVASEETIFRSKRTPAEQEELDRLADDGGPVREKDEVAVEQQGLGYYIVVNKSVDETHPLIRNLAIKDKTAESSSNVNAPGWRSYVNGLIGKLRGADDTLSYNDTLNRKVATYAPSNLQKAMVDEGKYIADVKKGIERFDVDGSPIPWYTAHVNSFLGKLSNREVWDQFKDVLDYARKAIDPDTQKVGYFFKNPEELYNHYQVNYQRTPEFREVQGYFAFVRMAEYDLALRKINLYRNKARLGSEQHSWTMTDAGGNKFNTPFIEGFIKRELPSGEGSLLHITADGKWKLYTEGTFQNISEELRRGISAGSKTAIEIWNPEARALTNIFDDAGNVARVRYVISDTVDSKSLSMANQLERRGGGHFEYDYTHYIKQARMRRERIGNSIRDWYEGDTTLMPIENGALGREIVQHMEEVRKLLLNKKEAEAEAYINQHLPIKSDKVIGWFKESRGPDGEAFAPRLSLNEPFHVIKTNQSIYGVDKALEDRYKFIGKDGNTVDTFKDGTKSGSAARAYQVKFTAERDAENPWTIVDRGSKSDPLYAYEPAKLTDPIPTMNRGLNRIINSTFMDDYKTFAVEHWLEENKGILKADEREIRSSPFHAFMEADNEKAFKPDAPKNLVNNARNNLYKIQQFVGVPDKFDTQIQALTQFLTDSAYEKFGPSGTRTLGQKVYTVVPLYLLNKVTDPITALRSFAFNAKLGLFALPQLLVQMQNFANIIALSPGHVAQGTLGAMFHGWTRFNRNPEVLAALDAKASAMGWKPGVWREAMETYEKTGFKNVQGEYAGINNAFDKHFITNGKDTFLNLGQSFFRYGEAASRHGAWYTSFSEFRTANPIGAITEADIHSILNRADLLYNNMSRASSSMLHGGVLSMTTQFLAYQLRLAELFVSKRISNMDRVRMFGTYAALYGVPSAFGLTGLPLGDYFRKAALDHGYVPGNNFIPTLLAEGIPSMFLALITGKGDFQKGNFYNVGDRYGAQGFTQIREALRSDTKWWNLLGGASTSIFANTVANTDGAYKAFLSIIKGDQQSFPLKLDDLLDIFNEFSSVSQLRKLIMAVNTGKWMTKNEVFVDRASPADAIFMGLTGLSHQAQDDQFTKSWTHQDEEALQKDATKFAIKELQRGYAEVDKNPSSASQHFTRASATMEIAGMPTELRSQIFAQSAKGFESTIDHSDYNNAFKKVPTNKSMFGGLITTDSDVKATRFQQFQDIQNIKNKREE